MASFQVLYWYDIPVQVRALGASRRDRLSQELSPRFMAAVDSAAMSAGLVGSDAYMTGFKWTPAQEREGEPPAVLAAVAAELEAQYENLDWRATAAKLKAERKEG